MIGAARRSRVVATRARAGGELRRAPGRRRASRAVRCSATIASARTRSSSCWAPAAGAAPRCRAAQRRDSDALRTIVDKSLEKVPAGSGTNRCAIWWSISADRHARPSRPVRRVRRGAETTGGRRGDWSIELVRSEVGRATGEVVVDGCKRRPHRSRPTVVSSGTPPARQLSARAGGRDWRHAYQSVDRNRSLLRPICGSGTR